MHHMQGKVAVVSGGAGQIGFEICRRFCENGMRVAIFGSSLEKAQETAERLGEYRENCFPVECNVTKTEVVRQVMAETNDRFGGIDVVVSMQGWPPKKQEITDITDEYWNGVLASHLTGSFHMLQQAIPYLERSLAPRVIFLASHGAFTADSEDGLAFSAAKGGIVSMTYYAAKMLEKKGITVNCIATGGIYNVYGLVENEADLIKRAQLGGLSTPEEVCAAVLHLASEEAGSITGEVVNINSGLPMS
jgi:3-oxoacyl-[acyl-carrier protein] reductase